MSSVSRSSLNLKAAREREQLRACQEASSEGNASGDFGLFHYGPVRPPSRAALAKTDEAMRAIEALSNSRAVDYALLVGNSRDDGSGPFVGASSEAVLEMDAIDTPHASSDLSSDDDNISGTVRNAENGASILARRGHLRRQSRVASATGSVSSVASSVLGRKRSMPDINKSLAHMDRKKTPMLSHMKSTPSLSSFKFNSSSSLLNGPSLTPMGSRLHMDAPASPDLRKKAMVHFQAESEDDVPVGGGLRRSESKRLQQLGVLDEGSEDDGEDERELTAKERVAHILEAWPLAVVATTVTIFVLFVDDAVLLASPRRTQAIIEMIFAFLVLKNLCFLYFLMELVASLVAIPGYARTFFFALDVAALVSFAPDVTLLLFQTDILAPMGVLFDVRIGRAARAAARAARLARAVRTIKVVLQSEDNNLTMFDSIAARLKSEDQLHGASFMGKKLTKMTTTTVTAIVLMPFVVFSVVVVERSWEPYAAAGLQAIEVTASLGDANTSVSLQQPLLEAYENRLAEDNVVLAFLVVKGVVWKGSLAALDVYLPECISEVISGGNTSQAYFADCHWVRKEVTRYLPWK